MHGGLPPGKPTQAEHLASLLERHSVGLTDRLTTHVVEASVLVDGCHSMPSPHPKPRGWSLWYGPLASGNQWLGLALP